MIKLLKLKEISYILKILVAILFVFFLNTSTYLFAQVPANPASWHFPDGNKEATKYVPFRSKEQQLDSFKIKWSSNYIFGDVQPLIGNIIHNNRIIDDPEAFPFSPNEIAAVIGDNLIILNGAGKVLANYELVDNNRNGIGILGVSALLDTNSNSFTPYNSARTLVLGFETIESKRPDSLAVAYLGGWNHTSTNEGNFGILRRIALNLKSDYLPNVSASLKPIYARKRIANEYNNNPGYAIYATVNMSKPTISNSNTSGRAFYRGLATFNLHDANIGYPLPDESDEYYNRMHIGPQVSFAQPSISNFQDTDNAILLPCLPTATSNNEIVENTFPNEAYILCYDITDEANSEKFIYSLTEEVDTRPRIRNYYLELNDAGAEEEGVQEYFLMTTEYNGIEGAEGSRGRPGLFLYSSDGTQLYDLDDIDRSAHPFFGTKDHYWSVATGNVDGRSSNEWLPCYPNNPGNEIIVTQSTRDFAYPASKLMVLRYRTGIPVPKASPPGENLRHLDTICTGTIKGWVAAVNDLDGKDGKDEIVIVGGTDLKVLRMRDYTSVEFRSGNHFDTVFTYTFPNQTITATAISDVDGDGLNDIIVTTNEGLYVLGTPLTRTIAIKELKETNPDGYQIDYCFGDTLNITWTNIIEGNNSVDIYLKLYKDGKVMSPDSLIILEKDYPNSNDTMTYRIVIDTNFAGLEGQIIVRSTLNPYKNADTTAYLKFNRPQINFNSGDFNVIYSGENINVQGNAICADSVGLLYSFDGIEWTEIGKTHIDSLTGRFELITQMPCLAQLFSCDILKGDTTILGKIIYKKNLLVDSSDVFPMTIKPARLPIIIEPCQTVCPSRTITWKIPEGQDSLSNLIVLLSEDLGESFIQVGSVPITNEKYIWNVPTNMKDTILLRFCGTETCLRTDTLIWNYKPHYIKTVAPNPMKVPQEVEIVYVINEDVKVKMHIINQANKIVRVLVNNEERKAGFAYCERWNGRLNDQTIVANGMYYVYLELSNGATEVYPIFVRN
ncbi:MAG: VCBS repeat-containing protein [Ignavibacteria bacterium]|jgi:hypothetical protein|nr:VCBS repeat-containing protein [Ignavibacteria bacterium]